MVTDNDTKVKTTNLRGGGCEDGLYNCGGVCVPWPCPVDSDIFETYIHLRAVLDSLETFALRYFLKGKNVATRKNRAENIIEALQPVLEIVKAKAKLRKSSTSERKS